MTGEDKSKMDGKHGYGEIRFRAQHGQGLVLDKVKSGSRTIELRLRDRHHADIEAILEEAGLIEAASTLEQAHMALVRGLGYTVQEIDRVRGHSTAASDHLAVMVQDFIQWPDKCKAKHYSPKMCQAVIVEGRTLTSQDEEYHFRKGTAKLNMINCLTVWGEMRKT